MRTLLALTKRNIKLFFKDKAMFFTSLITPVILLVLYITFLGNVFRDAIASASPSGFEISDKIVGGIVGGQLFSSILAVSCVTVAFCSNLIMVQDKTSGARQDLMMTPSKKSTLALSYFLATAVVTMIIILVTIAICLIYLSIVGWYLSFADIMLILLDSFLLVLFGTALSSLVIMPLKTNGQASAVGTIVSAGYGFICGAYMPISSFSTGLQNILAFLPGTYGTSLIRNHTMNGALNALIKEGAPTEVINGIRDSIDCNIYIFGNSVSIGNMYLILTGSVIALIGIYVLINFIKKKHHKKKLVPKDAN